jgi:hypothetical protein
MKDIFVTAAAVVALALCAGCAPKPSNTDIEAVLTEHVPNAFIAVASVEGTQADITGGSDASLVKFKSHLKLSQPLYKAVDFDANLKSTASDVTRYALIEESARALTPAVRDKFAAAIKKASFKPVFIAQTAPTGATADWYGAFRTIRVVDKWVASDFNTEVDPALDG